MFVSSSTIEFMLNVIFNRLRPFRNPNHVKHAKMGISRERVGLAQKNFQIRILCNEHYQFDISTDFTSLNQNRIFY